MKAETLQLQQGSEAWHAHRAKHFNASDASAMMGLSPYKTRAELLREKATGIMPEVDAATQRRFDRGHEIEALARPIAERIIGSELYPVVLSADVDGLPLSASLDGLTMLETEAFECKTMNANLAEALSCALIPDEYHPQMEQGLMLSGAERCLFMASDGTEEGTLWAWYESSPAVRAKLLAGWKQFAEDLSTYQPEPVAQPVVAAPQMALPAVSIQVDGRITMTDNLTKFGDALTDYVGRINKTPETDQDFADLEAMAKVLRQAVEALDAAENGALAQTESIDTMRRLVAQYRELARQNAILAENLVKNEKTNRKAAIIREGREKLAEHIKGLNERIGGQWMPVIEADFAGVIKGLKTLSSCKDKVGNELARTKIEASATADTIERNAKSLEHAGGNSYMFLFPDFKQVCTKAPEDFANLVQARIHQHQERVDAEAKSKAEQPAPVPVVTPTLSEVMQAAAPAAVARAFDAGPLGGGDIYQPDEVEDSGARMKLGDICTRLGFTVTADFLSRLGYEPVAHEKNAKIYRECDFPGICAAIIRHVQARVDEGDGVYRSWD